MKRQDLSARQAKALRGSILKWKKIANGTGKNRGAANCSLCQLYLDGLKVDCVGCPVMAATGKDGCVGTPYYQYITTGYRSDAVSMLNFLKSILDAAYVRKAKQKDAP